MWNMGVTIGIKLRVTQQLSNRFDDLKKHILWNVVQKGNVLSLSCVIIRYDNCSSTKSGAVTN